jgi:hypothetical protein
MRTIGQSFWETFKGFSAHYDVMPRCKRFEMLEIIGQMPKQFVVFSYGIILGYGSNLYEHFVKFFFVKK